MEELRKEEKIQEHRIHRKGTEDTEKRQKNSWDFSVLSVAFLCILRSSFDFKKPC
jgi:hypothetical protein